MSFLDKITALAGQKSGQTAKYFFALNIGLSFATAALWEVVDDKVDILNSAAVSYTDTEELLEKAHIALDRTLGALEIEPEKILFGVPDSWLLDEDLKEPYLKLLRRMVKEYELAPMAYVSTSASLAYYLQKQEGIPPTAILVGIDDHVTVSTLRGGKVVSVKSVTRSDNLFEDIEKSLDHLNDAEVFPSKILLYSSTLEGEKLEKMKDTLVSAPWMQRLSFLHLPKIEALGEKVATVAVVLAGSVEVIPEVDLKNSFASVGHTTAKVSHSSSSRAELLSQEEALEKDTEAAKETAEKPENLGFIKGDIAEQTADDSHEVTEEATEDGLLPATGQAGKQAQQVFALNDEALEEDSLLTGGVPAPHSAREGLVSQELGLAVDRMSRLAKGLLLRGGLLKVAAVMVLLAGAAAAFLFFVKAEVVVYVEPQALTREAQVVADPKASSVDEGKKVIPGKVVETTVSGSGKAAATGTKQIGDPARGQIVLYNKTDSAKTFSQGTTLAGPSGLKFTLDANVAVASQSGVEGGIAFGKAVGSVTAAAIGPDSNLSAGTQLQVGNFPATSFSAKVDTALSGGTAKDVTVVTAEDQRKLQSQVTDELKRQAAEELQGKMSGPNKVITDGLAVVDSKYNFNKRVNDQGSELTLNATVRFKGTSYSDEDLKMIVSKLVETNVPEGFTLNLAETETQADVAKIEKDGRLVFLARFKAKLLPKIDAAELKSKMKGKSAAEVGELLRGMEHILGSEVKLTPNLPAQLARLPLFERNIEVIITPK